MTDNKIVRHGNLLRVKNVGVLITGASGIGKSELSIALLDRGHQIVSDDATEIYRDEGVLVGTCPEPIKGFMQINHIGTINIKKIFGNNAQIEKQVIDVNIALQDPQETDLPAHAMKPTESKTTFLDVKIPTFHVPIIVGKQIPLLIEILVQNLKLKERGYDSYHDLKQKQRKLTIEKK